MQFEWNRDKDRFNLKKHGIDFETACLAFQDPFIMSVTDNRYDYSEERWLSLGLIQGIVIFIAHTAGEDINGEEIIRIISARAATTSEIHRYYANRKGHKAT